MLDELQKAVTAKADFIEIRAATVHSSHVSLRETEVEQTMYGSSTGFGVRVLEKGAWGFAYTSEKEKLWETVIQAIKLAKTTGRKPLEVELAGKNNSQDNIIIKTKKHPRDFTLEEKVSVCKELLPEKKKGIVTFDLQYADGWGESYYVNSEGAAIEYHPVRSFFRFSAFSKKNGQLLDASDRDGALKGLELLDNKQPLVNKVVKNALLLQKSKLPPKGKMTVIIDPNMAGTFAHEMVGHACEGDAVANGKSILGKKLNRLIGSRHVNISDDPSIPKLFGSYPYDAEGTKTGKTKIFENGRLINFLHSQETAGRLKLKPTGNARAESVGHFPIVRMSNTFFEPGEHKLEELFEKTNGIYVHGMKGGVVEPNTGVFQFACEYGYLIENGEKTTPLRDITLVGNILETLRHVEACANDFKGGHPAFCGKAGQTAFVSDGGPHIKLKEMLVG